MRLDLFPRRRESEWIDDLRALLREAAEGCDEPTSAERVLEGLAIVEHILYQRGILLGICVGMKAEIFTPTTRKPPYSTVRVTCLREKTGWSVRAIDRIEMDHFSHDWVKWAIPSASLEEVMRSIRASIPVF